MVVSGWIWLGKMLSLVGKRLSWVGAGSGYPFDRRRALCYRRAGASYYVTSDALRPAPDGYSVTETALATRDSLDGGRTPALAGCSSKHGCASCPRAEDGGHVRFSVLSGSVDRNRWRPRRSYNVKGASPASHRIMPNGLGAGFAFVRTGPIDITVSPSAGDQNPGTQTTRCTTAHKVVHHRVRS